MIDLIAGNICSLLAMVTDSVSASRKTARGVLLVQTLSQLFYGMSAIILKGYSAAVQNAVSAVRNLLAVSKSRSKLKAVEMLLILLAVALGLCFNNRGLVGLLPVVASLEYSLAVFWFEDNERALKIAFLVNAVLFGVFNGAVLNIVGVIANIVVVISVTVFLLRDKKA